jgi:hypothetical protein
MAVQNDCNRENRDRSEKIDCGNLDELVDAVAKDIEIARNVVESIQRAHGENTTLDEPVHEGEDSNLCVAPKKKICSVNSGCTCTN